MTGRRKRGRPRRGEGPALDDLDVMLAREFQQRPAFYDRTHPQYRNRDYLEGMWMDMAESVGQNVGVVKNRMVQLRNRYNLEKRRVEMLQDQYNDPSITSQWPMYNYLTYLGDHIKQRRSFTKEVIVRPKSAPFSNSRPVRFAYCSDSDGCDEPNPYPPCPPVAATVQERQLIRDLSNNISQSNSNANYHSAQPPTPDREEDRNSNPNSNFCKFRAFGQFLASSLIEMNQRDALHLVEKFTSDLVKSLLLETHNKSSVGQVEAVVNGHN
ncbi:uncharacterized protein LOC128857827 isoform X1 [Anastrepha ludens]|uniref:uncharacterized protein LOC128857827 isoform X1 n=1 Tax=Anastrepha ludens TaxID=28586 RepID=UPI0023AF6254|nr:uncharacterized protein LOC128857827 isoform X1 [Anastrepha ludens]XP_053949594.1 uncharacterized protein LOC128857827 isoform X1 [Anastrepha ludens]